MSRGKKTMSDTWVVMPRSLLRLTDLEWLFDTYPDNIFELPFGYFSKSEDDITEQLRLFVQLKETIK